MNRTASTWGERVAATLGAGVIAFAAFSLPAAQAASVNLAKSPREADFLDANFGTPGVTVVATVPGVDINRVDPNVDDWVVGGKNISVTIATKGFGKGRLTVWIQAAGDVDGVGRTAWRKFVVAPDRKGNVKVTVKPGKVDHCAAVWIRVNDSKGKWAEEDFSLLVRKDAPPAGGTPGVIG
jgi:hypothetical protein